MFENTHLDSINLGQRISELLLLVGQLEHWKQSTLLSDRDMREVEAQVNIVERGIAELRERYSLRKWEPVLYEGLFLIHLDESGRELLSQVCSEARTEAKFWKVNGDTFLLRATDYEAMHNALHCFYIEHTPYRIGR